jgi:hypothetical protein
MSAERPPVPAETGPQPWCVKWKTRRCFKRNLPASVRNGPVAPALDSEAIESLTRRATMNRPVNPGLFDDPATDPDEADFSAEEWSLDEFDDDADLASLQSAWMGGNDRFE